MRKLILLLCICLITIGVWADTIVQAPGLSGTQNPIAKNPGVSLAPLVQSPIVKAPDLSTVTFVAPPTSATGDTRLEVVPPKVGEVKVDPEAVTAAGTMKFYQGPTKPLISSLRKGTKEPEYVPGELLVKYDINKIAKNAGDYSTAIQKINAQAGVSTKYDYKNLQYPGLQLVKITSAKDIKQAQNDLKASGFVSYAEPNYIVHADVIPNDPRFKDLWGLHNTGQGGGTANADIDAPEAWNVVKGNTGIIIAVIDTGVDYTHPDLSPNMWRDKDGSVGYDFYNGDRDPMDDHGHGTHVAGTIAAKGNNKVGVAGVMWNAKIMAMKFLGADGNGYTSDAIMCILWAKMKGAKVTSNSWGGGGYSQALCDVMKDTGILHICAAGNSGSNNDASPHYPSSYNIPNIIAVAASTNKDQLAHFSCYGKTSVDVAAPGVNILSCKPGELTKVTNLKVNEPFTALTGWTRNHWYLDNKTYVSSPSSVKTGVYENNANYYLTKTAAINLAGVTKPAVEFRIKGKSEIFYDYLIIEVKTGTGPWTPVWYISGEFPRWYLIRLPLPSTYAGKTIKFRLHFESDSTNTYNGFYVDDLKIGQGTYAYGYQTMSGTSMATPHVSGLVGLVYAKHPKYSPAQIKNIILTKGEAKPAFKGKMVSGKRINANLAVRA